MTNKAKKKHYEGITMETILRITDEIEAVHDEMLNVKYINGHTVHIASTDNDMFASEIETVLKESNLTVEWI